MSEDLLRQAYAYQDALAAYAHAITRDWGAAQDAVQDALIALHRKADQFDRSRNLYVWLRQMVRLEALNQVRLKRREQSTEDAALTEIIDRRFSEHVDETAAHEIGRRTRALQECMSALGVDHAKLLLGFYRDRLSCESLAQLVGRSVNAVRLLLSRTRVQLRDCVTRRLAGGLVGERDAT